MKAAGRWRALPSVGLSAPRMYGRRGAVAPFPFVLLPFRRISMASSSSSSSVATRSVRGSALLHRRDRRALHLTWVCRRTTTTRPAAAVEAPAAPAPAEPTPGAPAGEQQEAEEEVVDMADGAAGFNGSDPHEVARAMLAYLKDAGAQKHTTKQQAARLRAMLRDLPQGGGIGRALFEVSRELGLQRTGRLLPLLYSGQEKGNINRLTHMIITLGHAHAQGNKSKAKSRADAVGEIISGAVDNWEMEDVVKLLRIVPRSPYYSIEEGKEHQPSDARWSPQELGSLISKVQVGRAKKRDMEFYMDVLVKLLTASEKEGGWGKEKSAPVSKASGDNKSKDAASLSKTTAVYDLDYVPKVVGPALGSFYDYWSNQDYATVLTCLITAFAQHAADKYGLQTVTRADYQQFSLDMMAETAIHATPSVGLVHYMMADVTEGWEESEVDEVSMKLEERLKPHSFLRRLWRRVMGGSSS